MTILDLRHNNRIAVQYLVYIFGPTSKIENNPTNRGYVRSDSDLASTFWHLRSRTEAGIATSSTQSEINDTTRTVAHSDTMQAHPEILQNRILESNIALSKSVGLRRCFPPGHRHGDPYTAYTALFYASAENLNDMGAPVASRGGDCRLDRFLA